MGAGASTIGNPDPSAELFSEADSGQKGAVSLQQLQAAVARRGGQSVQWTPDQIKLKFERHDADRDGFLSKSEYMSALAELGTRSDIDTGAMTPARAWDTQKHNNSEVSVALSLVHETKAAFLGAEVKKATNVEQLFSDAWQHLGRGEVDAARKLTDELLIIDKHNEKVYYTRAVCYARQAHWRYALADYSMYLKLVQETTGPALANALYGRALCLAKLGKRALALRDLDEAIRVGPEDEQLTDQFTSLVPMAHIARFALLSACPDLRKHLPKPEPTAPPPAATSMLAVAQAAQKEQAAAAQDGSSYEEPVWQILVTDLDVAIEKALLTGRTPLLIDGTKEKAVDAFFLYVPTAVVEAKRLVVDVRMAGTPLEVAREKLRENLVHAMRWGLTLLIRLANSAADFKNQYCAPDTFPLAVFDRSKHPTGRDANADPMWSPIFRPTDIASEGGRLHVPSSFRVCVSTFFAPTTYADLLKESLPLEALRPMHIVERAGGTRVADLPKSGEIRPGIKVEARGAVDTTSRLEKEYGAVQEDGS